MPKKNIHVTRRQDSWAAIRENADRAIGLFDTQSEALETMRPMA